VPDTRATVRAFSTTAARLTSTHARDWRPLFDPFTGGGMITRKPKRKQGMPIRHRKKRVLPPLQVALRLQELAARVGFDWPDVRGPIEKVKEEIAELERETGKGKREALEEELGDLLFAVVNLARKLAVAPRAALERANHKFARRFAAVERLAAKRGLVMGRASLDQLDQLWEEVKSRRR
jgi:uncharacterized protein YabN with tetrapyrrole methylase and pyrophosphatase domain